MTQCFSFSVVVGPYLREYMFDARVPNNAAKDMITRIIVCPKQQIVVVVNSPIVLRGIVRRTFRVRDHFRGSSWTVTCSMSTLVTTGILIGARVVLSGSFSVVTEAIVIAGIIRLFALFDDEPGGGVFGEWESALSDQLNKYSH